MFGIGLRMMGGQSAAMTAVDQSAVAPMYQLPPPSTRTYTFPNSRMINLRCYRLTNPAAFKNKSGMQGPC